MAFLIAVLVGAVFGSTDQYLGSVSHIPWLGEVSLLSAPWLVLPFVFGCTQVRARRAVQIGCAATAAALIGYFVMTLTPWEGVHLNGSLGPVFALLHSEAKVIVGGGVTSPLFGYLGYRWRTTRAWLSAALVAGAICLEPLAAAAVGRLPQFSAVWMTELAVGLAAAIYFGLTGRRYRSVRQDIVSARSGGNQTNLDDQLLNFSVDGVQRRLCRS
jgi:hypothetical protein